MNLRLLIVVLLLFAETLAAQGPQLVISEIMPDPSPSNGLPEEEYIELTNVSGRTLDISGWSISNGRTRGVIPDSTILLSGAIRILCPERAAPAFSAWGPLLMLKPFPAMANEGDTLLLYNRDTVLVHAVAYSPLSFSKEKRTGGWSLELADLARACSFDKNWRASEDPSGGSPGKPNLPAASPFNNGPDIRFAWCPDAGHIKIIFTDAMDSIAAVNPLNYSLENGPPVTAARIASPLADEILLNLGGTLQMGQLYSLKVNSLRNCLQEESGGSRTVVTGLAGGSPDSVIFHELMADPPAGGSDFLEIKNIGHQVLALGQLGVATRTSNGDLSGIRFLQPAHRNLLPGEILAFTTDLGWTSKRYHLQQPQQVIEMVSLPAMPNDLGKMVLVDSSGRNLLDELHYNRDWHFELIRSAEGVSLERIDALGATQDKTNWHSAAMHAGYGTPGYVNSQQNSTTGTQEIFPDPALFSPDGDGFQEETVFRYRFREPGTVATIRIFNESGRMVRLLVNNALCGTSGYYRWNGRGDNTKLLPTGIYFVSVETFRLEGKTKRYRFAVTLAR